MDKKMYWFWMGVKYAFLIFVAGLMLWNGLNIETFSSVVSILAIVIFATYFTSQRKKKFPTDERTKTLGAYAAAYSWMSTLVIVSGFYIMSHYGHLNLSLAQALGFVFTTMIVTLLLFQVYFSKKGTVD